MSEEQLKVDLELEGDAENKVEPDELTGEEARAAEDGWRPESEWEGETKDWIGAKEFNFRGELMSRISSQTAQLTATEKKTDELTKALHILGEHHKKTSETEHKRILKALKNEKIMAMEEGDVATTVELDDKIADLKESKKVEDAQFVEAKQTQEANGVPPEVTSWLASTENAWYHTDPIRKGVADALSDAYVRDNPNAPIIDMLKHVDKAIRQEMPHKFTNPNATNGKVTETSTTKRSKNKKFTSRDLDDEQKVAAKTFVDMGVFGSMQEYVDELVSNGDLG